MGFFQRFLDDLSNALSLAPRSPQGALFLNHSSSVVASITDEQGAKNSIVLAVVGWVQRAFGEAPPTLQQYVSEQWEYVALTDARYRVVDMLERPTPWYSGAELWRATVADLMLSGNAYWLIIRNDMGAPVQLWWVPSTAITPKRAQGENTRRSLSIAIDHYEYQTETGPHSAPPRDVIHFRDGMDPHDPILGCSPFRALLREIATDEYASQLTETLMRNMGVPGVVIVPDAGVDPRSWTPERARIVAEDFARAFRGENQGKPYVPPVPVKLERFGWSPEQLKLRDLRGLSEERITAVMGVNAAVLNLGAGLSTTKVGATLHEFREEAYETRIIPMYRDISSQLNHQLLPQMGLPLRRRHRLVFDTRDVRVLQDDRIKRSERVSAEVLAGRLRVSEARRLEGLPVDDGDEIYLRPNSHTPTTGESVELPAAPDPAPEEAPF